MSKKVANVYQSKPEVSIKYPDLDPEGGFSSSGERGYGLSLLLIDQISAESYIKELLGLYRDSEQGKLSDYKYHYPLTGLLGIHYNESGKYDKVIPKSYLPYKNGKITWNTPYQGVPASAMTLRGFNSKVAGAVGIGASSNGMSYTGKYVNALQIDRSYFDGSFKSKINGYNTESSRNADMMYLPDSLAYMDKEYTNLLTSLALEGYEDATVLAGTMSTSHNAGPGYLRNTSAFGTYSSASSNPHLKAQNPNKEEYGKHSVGVAEDMSKAMKAYTSTQIADISKEEAPAAGMIMLLDAGYYLTEDSYRVYTGGHKFNRSEAMLKSWKTLKGELLTKDQMKVKLRPYVKKVSEAYPGYATDSQVIKTYSDRYLTDPKAATFKLSTVTSPVYKNKINGKDPRVLHVINAEGVGHMFSAMTGDYIYEKLLQVSGVNVDTTKPSTYYEDKKEEYIPKGGEFDVVLQRMGVTQINVKAKDMLEVAYKVSGQYYNWGGKGEKITDANWNTIGGSYSPGSQYYNARINSRRTHHYKTRDGTDPSVKYNRRDGNLVNYKKQVFDCSGLIQWAYNHSKAKGSRGLEANTVGQASSSLLTTISDRSQAKPGDIYVASGDHVFFFIAKANNATLSPAETNTNKSYTASSGNIWVLEASTTGEVTGIHARKVGPKYKLRRFDTLK